MAALSKCLTSCSPGDGVPQAAPLVLFVYLAFWNGFFRGASLLAGLRLSALEVFPERGR